METKKCIVLGATGETGKKLLYLLAVQENVFDEIIVLNRRHVEYYHQENITQRVVDFQGDLQSQLNDFEPGTVQVTFCCIGSSLTKASKVISILSTTLNDYRGEYFVT